jgi:predicted transcriptional regulator
MAKDTITTAIKLPREIHRALRAVAEKEDRSASSIVRLALTKYFEAGGYVVEPKTTATPAAKPRAHADG